MSAALAYQAETQAEYRKRRGLVRATPDDYLWCRTFGHQWDAWHSTERRPSWGYYESVYCGRCSTERHFIIDSNGNVSSRRYVYPPDYRLGFRMSAPELRRELRQRGYWDPKARITAAEIAARPRRRHVQPPRSKSQTRTRRLTVVRD